MYKRDSAIRSQHSGVSSLYEHLTMAEMTDKELNEHMDKYEQASV